MDISFNIPRAGPLSQISAHIVSLDTAIWLATGAVGWWKAKERSLSLTETLAARKMSLVSTSSFNYAEYRRIREHGPITGLSARLGVLRRLENGPESTAVTENSNIDCLRALATGLLCFYSEQLTSIILADIIPYGLLQSEQDGDLFEFDGPSFASLSEWVKAVATEEDCNNFRLRLTQKSSTACQELLGSHVIQPNDDDGQNELGLLLGCLRWMITPKHRRELLKYPTRSIRVWTTMAVMFEMGFSVSVFLNVVNTKEQYDVVLKPPYEDEYPDVVLVTLPGGRTDPEVVMEDTYQHLTIRPQIIPILSIPYTAFGRLQRQYSLIDAAELTDIWKQCFRYAKAGVTRPTLSTGGRVHLKPSSSEYTVHRESHKSLIGLWSPHLTGILGPAFNAYLPKTLDHDWSPERVKTFLDHQASGERIYLEDVDVMRNVCKLTAIVLGTIYGACSIALVPQASADQTNSLGDEALEVAFSPDVIFSNKIFAWAAVLGSALSGLLEHSGWIGLLLELVTGIEHPRPLDEQPTAGLPHKNSNIAQEGVFDKINVRVSDIMGVQSNGVFAVSEFVLRPSSDAASSLIFHVGIGRILDIPIDQSGYVRSSRHVAASSELVLDPEPEVERLSRDVSPDAFFDVRIDAEPHWRNDPQTICFAVRNSGALVATLNIPQVLEKLLNCTVKCSCDSPSFDVSVARSERWQNVTVNQLHKSGIPGAPKTSVFVGDRDKIMINVVGNDACRIYTTGLLSCRKLAICKDCVSCALQATRAKRNNVNAQSTALIVG
jgi:hypothetical protein